MATAASAGQSWSLCRFAQEWKEVSPHSVALKVPLNLLRIVMRRLYSFHFPNFFPQEAEIITLTFHTHSYIVF